MNFYREKIPALSSLVDLRRTAVLAHARRSLQLLLSFRILANKSKISSRRDSNSRTNNSNIRGLPRVTTRSLGRLQLIIISAGAVVLFLIPRRMGKSKAQAPTLPRVSNEDCSRQVGKKNKDSVGGPRMTRASSTTHRIIYHITRTYLVPVQPRQKRHTL